MSATSIKYDIHQFYGKSNNPVQFQIFNEIISVYSDRLAGNKKGCHSNHYVYRIRKVWLKYALDRPLLLTVFQPMDMLRSLTSCNSVYGIIADDENKCFRILQHDFRYVRGFCFGVSDTILQGSFVLLYSRIPFFLKENEIIVTQLV